MAAFFSETFPGSGSISGKAPDTAYGGYNWSLDSGTAAEVSGYLVVPGTYPEYDSPATVSYGTTTGHSLPASVSVSFTWKSGAIVDTSSGGASPQGLQMTFLLNDTTSVQVVLRSYYGNPWNLSLNDTYSEYSSTIDVTANIASSTDYTGTLTYSLDGNAVLTFLGQTITITPALTGGTGGFRNLSIYTGSYHNLGFISVDTYVAPSSGTATLPSFTAVGYGGGTVQRTLPALTATARGGGTAAATLPTLYLGRTPFFQDKLNGAVGALSAHAPNLGFGGYATWAGSSTGALNGDGSFTGYGVYGVPFSPPSPLTPSSWTVKFRVKTASDVTTTTAKTALSLSLSMRNTGGVYRSLVLQTAGSAAPWRLRSGDNDGDVIDTASIDTVAASTEYEGSYSVDWMQRTWTLRFMGVYTSGDLPTSNPAFATSIDAVTVSTSAGFSVLSMDIETAYGGEVRLPSFTAQGSGTVLVVSGNSAVATLPALQARGYGAAKVALILPAFKAYGIGNQITKDINYVAGALVAVGYGGATAKLAAPAFAVNLTGTFPNIGRLTVSLPALRTSGSVTIGEIGGIAARARALTAQGYGGANLVGVLGTLDAAGSGRSGNVARAALVLPKLAVMANGTVNGVNRAEIILPALAAGPYGSGAATFGALAALGYGRLVVEIIYEAYAINLKPRESRRPGTKPINEVTRYADVPFDGQFMYQGNCYGWGPGGLYLIGGETDDTVPIPYVMRTHPDDFGSTEKKTMRSAYFGGRFGPDATITLISGKEGENAYPYTTPRGVVAQNHRQKFGRGIKDRYLALEIAGEGALELDNFDPEVDKLTRRI